MNRKLAIENGLNKFQHKNGCKHCGSKERYVSSYTCVPCTLKKLDDSKLMNPYRTKEKTLLRVQKWRKNNPKKHQQQWLRDETVNARAAKRRAAVRNQLPEDADLNKIQQIYNECRLMTSETGTPYEVDHIIPISKGGFHHQDNLQILTKEENRKKGAQ
jgi:5-methylcytosine-specific restriction endonuclease McrA